MVSHLELARTRPTPARSAIRSTPTRRSTASSTLAMALQISQPISMITANASSFGMMLATEDQAFEMPWPQLTDIASLGPMRVPPTL